MAMSETALAARRQYQKDWQRKHPEKVRQYLKAWKKKNPDKVKAYRKEWNKKHPEKIKEYQQRYWTKKAAEGKAREASPKETAGSL